MRDIYEGNKVYAWEDDVAVYISFPWAMVCFPTEEWGGVLADLKNLVIAALEVEIEKVKKTETD